MASDRRIDDDIIVISEDDVVYEDPDNTDHAGQADNDARSREREPAHAGLDANGLDANDENEDANDEDLNDEHPAAAPADPPGSGAGQPGAFAVGADGTASATGAGGTGAHGAGAGWPDAGEVPEVPEAPAATPIPAAAQGNAAQSNWPEIQALFVDDPRSAVRQAADVMSGAVTALIAAARNREQSLQGTWEADGTGTEELRTALREYRDLSARIADLARHI